MHWKKSWKRFFLFHFVFSDLSFRCSLLIEPCSQPPSYTPSLLFHHFLFHFLRDFWHFKYTMSFVCQIWTSFPAQKVDLGNKGGQFPQSWHLAQKAEKMDYGLDSSQQKLWKLKTINWLNFRSSWLFPRFGFDLSLEKLCVSASASETWLPTLEKNLRSSENLSHQQLLRERYSEKSKFWTNMRT